MLFHGLGRLSDLDGKAGYRVSIGMGMVSFNRAVLQIEQKTRRVARLPLLGASPWPHTLPQ